MPANTAYYAYSPNQPLSAEEQQVQTRGFPFVSTTILGPGGKLHQHRHGSLNTHLIVSGSIIVAKSRDGNSRFRSGAQFAGAEITLPKNVDYIGDAGPDDCVFVEGHTILSPATADRFLSRGTIMEVDRDAEGAFTTEG